MPDELGTATRALKRALAGCGFVKRVRGVKGIPDFIVAFRSAPGVTFFVELKHANVRLHPVQAATLDDLARMGIPAILLNYISDGCWDIHFPPFIVAGRLRDMKVADRRCESLSADKLIK